MQQSFKTPTKRSAILLKDERTISDGPVSEIVSGHGRNRNGAKPKPHKQSKSEQLKRGRESRQSTMQGRNVSGIWKRLGGDMMMLFSNSIGRPESSPRT